MKFGSKKRLILLFSIFIGVALAYWLNYAVNGKISYTDILSSGNINNLLNFFSVKVIYLNLFYIPVILTAMWYRKKVVFIALVLGLLHVYITYFSVGFFAVGTIERAAALVMIAYIIAIISDKRVAEEKKLQKSEEKYRSLVESTDDTVYMVDKDCRYLSVNNKLLSQLGLLENQVVGKTFGEFHSPAETKEFVKRVNRVFETGKATKYESSNEHFGKWTIRTLSPIKEPNIGEVMAISVVTKDITERKQAEEQIKASLKEKEALLKEIHHRVKNNMQVISSLLNLQSKQSKDKQSLEMFTDSQHRVKSMALVHEKLYRSEDLTRIDFAKYVQSLISHLSSSYGINQKTKFDINIQDVLLDINTAIHCGLIINELVSNSLKHAFPNGRKGTSGTEGRVSKISVAINSNDEDKFTLTVSDNGVGFPKDLDLQNTKTLGLQLVTTLVEQLGGTIELDTPIPSGRGNGGTVFKVTFEKPKYEKKG